MSLVAGQMQRPKSLPADLSPKSNAWQLRPGAQLLAAISQ
jgi:hypothetical protein